MTRGRFELLGVSVGVRSASDELLERVGVCYRACATDRDDVELEAMVEAGSGGEWRVHVSGRPERAARGIDLAARALNHELMHAAMLRRPDLFYVHAGAVVLDGVAVVLPGLSRAGKSTLVLALVEAGADFLSDELLVYDPEARRARPFPRAIKVRDECVAYFPRLAEGFAGTGEGRLLRWEALGGAPLAGPAQPGLVVLPCYGAATRMEPASRATTLLRLTESALNFGTHRSRSIDHLAELTSMCRGFTLEWHDPRAAAALVGEALRREPA